MRIKDGYEHEDQRRSARVSARRGSKARERCCGSITQRFIDSMENKKKYAVTVKPSARRNICSGGMYWVKDVNCGNYVSLKDRGTWLTREEAKKQITEKWEIVVEV